ncbi:DUF3501 family protein [Parasalinivibrio latis]|uniref:DUF3501 family protein n=1 Tax=Parasalinivibrio latis TaxID=2952610 RepID=UPI0030E24814
MQKLTRIDLLSLEDYARQRPHYRKLVMEHKRPRQIALNKHARLYFEDRRTVQYQIQEMLRIEKIFEPDGIEEELAAYNPLIPDGQNLKATFMLEYPDAQERKAALSRLIGVEQKVWLAVDGMERVYPICDEDLERDNEEKTSSVHFMRFELPPSMIHALKQGAQLQAGVSHPNMDARIILTDTQRDALVADLDDIVLN